MAADTKVQGERGDRERWGLQQTGGHRLHPWVQPPPSSSRMPPGENAGPALFHLLSLQKVRNPVFRENASRLQTLVTSADCETPSGLTARP